jgi:iron complex transport system permease protein
MKTGKLSTLWCILLWILPAAVGLLALGMGRVSIPAADVLAAFTGIGGVSQLTRMTLWNLRLPRILLAALAGAGLSTAGCAFQSLFANPLATPDTLGVASGASFGAALGLLLGMPLLGVQLTALLMGGAAVALTWLAGSGKSKGLSTVVLAGIMMGSLFNAMVSLVKFIADEESQLPAIT